MATIGLIAGGGRFPLLLAESARAAGHRVVAVAHLNQTEKALEGLVESCTWVKLGQFGKVLEALKAGGAEGVVLLGGITKARFFRDAMLDGLWRCAPTTTCCGPSPAFSTSRGCR
jgi:UDP-2,3-diacylglucosamine hydrolase